MKRVIAAIAAVALAVGLSSCSVDGLSDPAFQTLRYEGGDTGGSKFKECIDEGEKLVSNDRFYSYPKTQRELVWDSNGYKDSNSDGQADAASTADFPDMKVIDKDGREVFVKMKISLFLNTSCADVKVNGKNYPGGTIQAFHELVGKTRNAYFDTGEDGNGTYGAGWLWVLTNYIGVPVQDYVQKAVRPQQVEALFTDTSKQVAIESGLLESLPALVDSVMESDLAFFKDFTVKIYNVTPDSEYLGLIKERENAQIKAQTAQANADAKVAEETANARVEQAKADVQRAKIAGFGGIENYLKSVLIEKGGNPYQPTYVVGGTSVK